MSLTTRLENGGPLTIEQMDNNLLYLEEIALAGGGTSSGGTGSLISIVTKTKEEIDLLITNNSLVPGQLYKITGVCKTTDDDTFYDDGTNSGTTIYLTALTNNILSEYGHGEFYNPVYYDSYGPSSFIVYGTWASGGGSQSYVIGDVVFWGGYAWSNLTGQHGNSISILELDSTNWEKLPYTSSHYEKVIDYIEYNYDLDFMTRRRNIKYNIDVMISPSYKTIDINFDYHPIIVTAWGLCDIEITVDPNRTGYCGLSNIVVNNSYFETINFTGGSLINLTLTNYTFISNIDFIGSKCKIFNSIFDSSQFINNWVSISLVNFKLTNTILESMFFAEYNNNDNISSIIFNDVTISNIDLSSANIIYESYIKNIFKRPDGLPRLSYIDNNDTLVITSITT